MSKTQGNQEKLHDDGRLRGFKQSCANLCILQLLTQNVKNSITALYRDTLFFPPCQGKREKAFLLCKTTHNRTATQRITEDSHGKKEKTEPSLFNAYDLQKSEGKTAAAPVSTVCSADNFPQLWKQIEFAQSQNP